MNPPLFALHNISKRFGYRTILKEINLEIFPQEFILLLGNNGTGKTTLLNILCTLTRPTKGHILYKQQRYKDVADHLRKNIGNISHESHLYSDLTAYENLKLFGNLYSVKDLSAKLNNALKYVELEFAKSLPVHTFSSGMTKRLAIAKLLLYQPEFLILDEPYTGLDQFSIRLFQNYLKKYQQEGGTILMVTHQFALGLELASRVIVLNQGKISHDVPTSQTSLKQCNLWMQQN